ncbi:MAG: hypothetical protein JWO31_145, partial [Phycisphaerales bacterium]|nr:hypothetical protein [Phycisphaerales bacterium]
GTNREAAAELQTVLELNDRLTQEERKRLPPETVFEIRKQISRLGGT